jgi:AcrR family transcriptional regulator
VVETKQDTPSRKSATVADESRRSARKGRPRSDRVHRAILDAFREVLSEDGFADLRLEHVAARAGVGKATIYRRWASKEALAQELLAELAAPHIAVAAADDTRTELLDAVLNPMRAVTDTPFGPVIRALLSQIAVNPTLGDPFRATVVQARRNEIARVIARGIARGDLRPDADADIATELLVGPVYFRLMFGGELTFEFANRVVDTVMSGYAIHDRTSSPPPTPTPRKESTRS